MSRDPSQTNILVAEDPFISSFLRTVLQKHGHKVMIGEALHPSDVLRNSGMNVDMVITNNPSEFLPFAETLPILYIAAGPDPTLASHFRRCRILRKPFRNEDLLDAVQDLSHAVLP